MPIFHTLGGMSAVLQRASIKYLSAQLADQIAAGEVIERPASVLKELIENALDAHATRLDIDLAAGGMERIRVSDNGDGIACDEMLLAISRHATSKISRLSDLLALHTLGFRGEALASICSVSQWQLTSNTGPDHDACRLSYLNPTQVQPDHHQQGTTVMIEKLFHNTPARKKFLRAERTEYRHCDDMIRRMALARFDVGFYVRHNTRQVQRLPAVDDDAGRVRRVVRICGEAFIRHALAVDYPREGMRLWGWIGSVDYSRQQTDLQYFYINGRIVRDRTIGHAIRLAYQSVLPIGRHPGFVLHLEIDPAAFDVNVHPTKQEVRFRQARLVHDFISHSLRDALATSNSEHRASSLLSDKPVARLPSPLARIAEPKAAYSLAADVGEARKPGVTSHAILFHRYLIDQQDTQTSLIDLSVAHAHWVVKRWWTQISSATVITRPMLIPERLQLADELYKTCTENQADLQRLGVDLTPITTTELVLRQLPVLLAAYDAGALVRALLKSQVDVSQAGLLTLLSDLQPDADKLALDDLLGDIKANPNDYRHCYRHLTADDLSRFFN